MVGKAGLAVNRFFRDPPGLPLPTPSTTRSWRHDDLVLPQRRSLRRLALLALAGCGGGDHSAVERRTEFGVVVGTDDSAANGTFNWKGIPFAKAPVGDLRWKAPVDPDAWTNDRDAKAFGNACVQTGRLYGPGQNNTYDATIGADARHQPSARRTASISMSGSRPVPAAPRPVIVFVHGGSNISGYTADPVYDGAMLAHTANVVVVTVNYRLGIFGFLDQTKLKTGASADDDSGNFAMLDIIKALSFVQRNIARFGGDPGRVTLMGESAGAANLYALLTSPLVVNASPLLFHRLVRPAAGCRWPPSCRRAASRSFTRRRPTRRKATCCCSTCSSPTAPSPTRPRRWPTWPPQTDPQIAAYLRSKTPNELLTTVLTRLAPIGASGAEPIPEGTVLPVDPIAEILAGRYLHVPVLAGNTRDEAKLFPSLLRSRRRSAA